MHDHSSVSSVRNPDSISSQKSRNHAGFRAFLTGLTVFLIPVHEIKSSVWNVKDNKKGERNTHCGNEVQITVSSVMNPSKSQ
jgi:hypothetical protein